MVIFMLYHSRGNSAKRPCALLKGFVKVRYCDTSVAWHFIGNAWYTQATFFVVPGICRPVHNSCVDEGFHYPLIILVEMSTALQLVHSIIGGLTIYHKKPDRQSDLWRCQTATVGIVHRLPHIGYHLLQARVGSFYVPALLF